MFHFDKNHILHFGRGVGLSTGEISAMTDRVIKEAARGHFRGRFREFQAQDQEK